MKTNQNIWVVEAHDLGALQVRPADDALKLNRKKWLEGVKADRLLVGIGGTIDEALEVERELKRMRRESNQKPEVSSQNMENGKE